MERMQAHATNNCAGGYGHFMLYQSRARAWDLAPTAAAAHRLAVLTTSAHQPQQAVDRLRCVAQQSGIGKWRLLYRTQINYKTPKHSCSLVASRYSFTCHVRDVTVKRG
ncbi:uncharacterized protein LOC118463837 [Anopheles albimanus]|uniref:uncharacterized protein LOC118463837 n=1 Tax=Anopheles albimanus TaxID=7167 RepID=UPI00163E1A83|nr:uncharacterized protein LOC118463837 [Anopheles albimanus]